MTKRPAIFSLLHWDRLFPLTTRFGKIAAAILIVLPIIAQAIGWLGFDPGHLKYPIIGALMYVLFCAITTAFCPELVKRHRTERTYLQHCADAGNTLDPFAEFARIQDLTQESVNRHFGDHAFLHPLSRGLAYNRPECISVHAAVIYAIENTSCVVLRVFLGVLVTLSVVMMEFLVLRRLVHVLTT